MKKHIGWSNGAAAHRIGPKPRQAVQRTNWVGEKSIGIVSVFIDGDMDADV